MSNDKKQRTRLAKPIEFTVVIRATEMFDGSGVLTGPDGLTIVSVSGPAEHVKTKWGSHQVFFRAKGIGEANKPTKQKPANAAENAAAAMLAKQEAEMAALKAMVAKLMENQTPAVKTPAPAKHTRKRA
jgi:hypothetical protein